MAQLQPAAIAWGTLPMGLCSRPNVRVENIDRRIRTYLCCHVNGCAMSEPLIQVRTDHHVPVVDKPSCCLTAEFVPSRGMMCKHDCRVWAPSVGPYKIRVHIVALVSLDRDELGACSSMTSRTIH